MELIRSVCLIAIFVLASAGSANAQLLGDTHMKLPNANCALCHSETPPSERPKEQVCVKCHGDLKTLGSKPIPKGTVNPQLNHVEELYCRDCHHMHKPSTNYCEECHDNKFLGMKVP